MNYGTVPQQQPSGGQFPGQQSDVTNQNAAKKGGKGASGPSGTNGVSRPGDAPQHLGGEGSSSQPEGPPPTYADVIKGDHKVQNP
jgi:hypothetical protein